MWNAILTTLPFLWHWCWSVKSVNMLQIVGFTIVTICLSTFQATVHVKCHSDKIVSCVKVLVDTYHRCWSVKSVIMLIIVGFTIVAIFLSVFQVTVLAKYHSDKILSYGISWDMCVVNADQTKCVIMSIMLVFTIVARFVSTFQVTVHVKCDSDK